MSITTLPAAGRRSREITKADRAAAKIHAVEQAQKIAERIKDPTALERALRLKLKAQRDFAAEYRSKFPHGKNQFSTGDDSTVVSSEWCLSFGFHVRTVQRWLELLFTDAFGRKENEIKKRCWQLAEMWQAANFSSESVEWFTPRRYVELVRQVLGEIDLDPASSVAANLVIGAKTFYTASDDGLSKEWNGRVFMNPPYGRTDEHPSLAAAFCNKALEEHAAGNIEACIILVNSLHSQAWQRPAYDHPICFVDHRIQFVSGDGEENKNPTFQNIFIYLGSDLAAFKRAFSTIGYVMVRA